MGGPTLSPKGALSAHFRTNRYLGLGKLLPPLSISSLKRFSAYLSESKLCGYCFSGNPQP